MTPLCDVLPASFGRWRGLDEVGAALDAAARQGAEAVEVARSRQGRPVRGVFVGPAGPVSLVLGGIHALEWIGVEVALGLLTSLLATPPPLRVLVVPVANPDGYARVEEGLRAGRRPYARGNAADVDLNRNWPTHWRTTGIPQRILTFLGSAGPGPRTEPEVDGLCALLDPIARGPGLVRALSLHSVGNKLLVPFGGRWARPEGAARHDAAADEVRARLGGRYAVTTPSRWVPGLFAYGMELDHFHTWGATALLVECSAGGLAVSDPGTWLHPFRWFNPPDPERHVADLVAALRPFVAPAPNAGAPGDVLRAVL